MTRSLAAVSADMAELMAKALASMPPALRAEVLAPYTPALETTAEAVE